LNEDDKDDKRGQWLKSLPRDQYEWLLEQIQDVNKVDEYSWLLQEEEAKKIQKSLRSFPDEKLMQLYLDVMVSCKSRSDYGLFLAALWETRRRYIDSGWFWKRWRKPSEFRKWQEFQLKTEQRATEVLKDLVEKGQMTAKSERKK
jgi:hypothetical protein